MSKVSRLRRIAKAVNEHCVPCMLRSGVASHESLLDCGTREHSMQCFKRSCMKCHSPHHFSRDCGVMFKARMNRCFACALKTVHGERFHKHAGVVLWLLFSVTPVISVTYVHRGDCTCHSSGRTVPVAGVTQVV